MAVESFDKLSGGHDLAADRPYLDLMEELDEVDGSHCGFPCGSFSMVRSKQGGPPPVRSRQWPYGLPDNTPAQQAEADRGTVLAVRSSLLSAKLLDSQRRRRMGEVATLENPPGSETGPDLPAWELAELQEFLTKYEAQKADFNSCIHMEGKQRWWKPARWAGRLQGWSPCQGNASAHHGYLTSRCWGRTEHPQRLNTQRHWRRSTPPWWSRSSSRTCNWSSGATRCSPRNKN